MGQPGRDGSASLGKQMEDDGGITPTEYQYSHLNVLKLLRLSGSRLSYQCCLSFS